MTDPNPTPAPSADDDAAFEADPYRGDWGVHGVERRVAALWMAHGGSHSGPRVEHVNMPMNRFMDFLAAFLAGRSSQLAARPSPSGEREDLLERIDRVLRWACDDTVEEAPTRSECIAAHDALVALAQPATGAVEPLKGLGDEMVEIAEWCEANDVPFDLTEAEAAKIAAVINAFARPTDTEGSAR